MTLTVVECITPNAMGIRNNHEYTDNPDESSNRKNQQSLQPEETVQTKFQSIVLMAVIFLASGSIYGQLDFDSPNVIQTSFTRKMAAQYSSGPVSGSSGCDSCASQQGTIYSGVGTGYAADSCDSCGVASYGGQAFGCGGCDDGCGIIEESCGFDCGGRQFGLTVSGIVDIPMDGVFQTSYDALVTAGTLGVPPATLAGATPIQTEF